MKCPVDNSVLLMSDKFGIEIDYCPECRGVWLDRGELDKIIDKSSYDQLGSAKGNRNDNYRINDQHYDKDYKDTKHHKKRESFLGDIFDF